MLSDLLHSTRSLIRRPLLSIVVVGSLALGVGVNAAIFSVFERVVLRPLPVPDSDQIVLVTSPGPKPGGTSTDKGGGHDQIFSYPLFRDLEAWEVPGVSRIAAHRDFAAIVAYEGQTARQNGLLVSGSYFPALGLQPALGRLFTPDDDRVDGAHPLAVLSHDYWRNAFGEDPGVIGRTVHVNGEALTIVGVGPARFRSTTSLDAPVVYVPLAMTERMRAGRVARNDHWLYLFARLQPGASRERVEADLSRRFSALIRDVEFPVQRTGLGDQGRREFLARQIVLADGSRERNTDRADEGLIIGLLLAVTGLVLLIACANVANLLLARATDRLTELAVRVSMGASRWRIVRLQMMEALLLGGLGATGGLVVGRFTSVALLGLLPADDASLLQFELNAWMLGFAGALGFATSIMFGLAPALHVLRAASGLTWTSGARGSAPRGAVRFRAALVTAQIALATAILGQTGLFLTSLANVSQAELGIRRDGLIAFRVSPYLNGYTPERARALFERLETDLRGQPGVAGVTASTLPLLADNGQSRNVTVGGYTPPSPEADMTVSFAQTGTDYFRTIGIPLLAGREFTEADGEGAPRVAVVNEAFARKFDLGDRVVGTRMAIGAGSNKALDIEIVGLVRDSKYSQVRDPDPPQLFVPYRQSQVGPLTFYVRTDAGTAAVRAAIPPLVARADPTLPVERLRTMDEQIWENITVERVLATLSSWFAGLATLLAACGLYAVLAYAVAQRRREIGIRMALGAGIADICRLVLGYVARVTLFGGALGAAAALGLGQVSQSMLYGVEGSDPRVLTGALALVALVALAAGAFPAGRAARVRPAEALKVN